MLWGKWCIHKRASRFTTMKYGKPISVWIHLRKPGRLPQRISNDTSQLCFNKNRASTCRQNESQLVCTNFIHVYPLFFHFFHVYGHKGNLYFQLAKGDCWFLGVNWLRTVTAHTLLSSLLCHINSKLILSQKTQNQMDFGKLYVRHINSKYLSHFSVGKKQHNHSSLPSSPNSFTVVTTTMKRQETLTKSLF